MINPFRSLVRMSGFAWKELIQVSRRPAMLAALLLGPLLILILFGAGFRSEKKLFRTVFITKKNDPISAPIYRYAPAMDSRFVFLGVFNNLEAAKEKLQKNEIDLVIIAPQNAGDLIARNQQAEFVLLHNSIDPSDSETIRLSGEIFVNGLNRWLLDQAVESGREQLQADVQQSINDASSIRKALERADLVSARQLELQLNRRLGGIGRAIRSRIEALEVPEGEGLRELLSNMSAIRSQLESPLVPENEKKNYSDDAERAGQVESDLIVLSAQLSRIKEVDARLLLSPFSSKVETVQMTQPRTREYFSPMILIILLQHVAITFSALALVREFKPGNQELFRAAPVRRSELLVGKYLSYIVLTSFVAALLTLLMVYAFHIPMLGNWMHYCFALGALMVASISLGFVISSISGTEEQAIHYSMLVFIASVVFAGVVLNPDFLWPPVRFLSWSLPATYGIEMVQDVMLRGNAVDWLPLAVLAGFGFVFYMLAWLLSGSKMART